MRWRVEKALLRTSEDVYAVVADFENMFD